MQKLIGEIFSVSEAIRYVALYRGGELLSAVKPGLPNATASESDKYEELIVNPTILTLAQQRGNIDCGGCEYVLVRYGHFYQFVTPVSDGHISVCISPEADALSLAGEIYTLIRRQALA